MGAELVARGHAATVLLAFDIERNVRVVKILGLVHFLQNVKVLAFVFLRHEVLTEVYVSELLLEILRVTVFHARIQL